MIPMNDFRREPTELRQTILQAIEKVLSGGQYVLGASVEEFERAWATRGQRRHGVGVANGLDAITLSLKALDIGQGDEVITTGMTAIATLLGILNVGAIPVLADIDPGTALLDIESAKKKITKRTKAILLVHLYGQIKHAEEWLALCSKNGVHLIEDCAQAHDACEKGKIAGSLGICGAFSFYPTKNLGAIGDAGMVLTDEIEIYNKIKSLRNYGQKDRYIHEYVGVNSRLDEIQAAILSAKLPYLESQTLRRRAIAARYREEIKNNKIKQLAKPVESTAHSYHLYVVRCENRNQLSDHLARCGIATIAHYPIPGHCQPALKGKIKFDSDLSNLEIHAAECLSIPISPFLRDEEVDQIIQSINNY